MTGTRLKVRWLMNRTSRRKLKRGKSSLIDLTPLIDVMVVLVILLTLESSFGLVVDAKRLHAGEGQSAKIGSTKQIAIAFDKAGKIKLEGKVISLDQLEEAINLLAKNDDVSFVLAGDAESKYGTFLTVEGILRRAGVEQYQRAYRKE